MGSGSRVVEVRTLNPASSGEAIFTAHFFCDEQRWIRSAGNYQGAPAVVHHRG